jgi:UrcA family protein
MYRKTAVVSVWSEFTAAIVACTLFAGNVAAQGQDVRVANTVSTQGVDLGTPAGAREFYLRLKNAAWYVCTRTDRVGLEPLQDPYACSEKALGDAVGSAHSPLLAQVYLETHSLGQAATHGISVPVQLAAK